MTRPRALFDRHPRAAAGTLVAAALLVAWLNRFVQDDAFISFRYAQRLAAGQGLTWNDGERVEGYTNFLWTLLHALPFRLGLDPVTFSYAVGLVSFGAALVATYGLAVRATGSTGLGRTALVLLGSNYSASAWATGGMEGALVAALLAAAASLALPGGPWPRPRLVAFSLLVAAALLTRLDSALCLGVLAAFVAAGIGSRDGRLGRLVALAGPSVLLVGGWLGFKLAYYGALLPNTLAAKLRPFELSWRPGLGYVAAFFGAYVLWLPAVLALPRLGRLARARFRPLLPLALALLVWIAYLVRVGGDFMEFRLLVPVLPFLFVLLAWVIRSATSSPVLRALVVLVVIGASLRHARGFHVVRGIEPVSLLARHLDDPRENWRGVGRTLGLLFGAQAADVSLATTAAGAIPFYSGLRTIDMLGLNDRFIAERGLPLDPRSSPGHTRIAPVDYLVRRRVNLVVGHPWVRPTSQADARGLPPAAPRAFRLFDFDPRLRADRALRLDVLELPLDGTYSVYVLYLVEHPAVDRVIRERGLRTFPLALDAPASGG